MQTLKERLIYVRKLKGYTQETLAKNTNGVSRSMIANIEADRWKANPLAIKELSDVLDVEFEWLMNGTGPMEKNADKDRLAKEISDAFSRLSREQQLFVLDVIRSMQRNLSPAKEPVQEPEQSGPRKVDDIITNVEARKKANKFPGRGY